MQPHQLAWLMCHPHRTVEWLKQRSKDGFDIHHLDGDPLNNAPDNLVLIETTDHLCVVHDFNRALARIPRAECKGKKPRTKKRREESRRKEALRELGFSTVQQYDRYISRLDGVERRTKIY